MTNDTTPAAPENEALAEAAAAIAAITTDTVSISDVAEAAAADAAPAEPPPPPGFEELGLHPDVKLALDDMGYFTPTPVQRAVFKPVSDGKDLLVQSRTGTGKTTAFGLPIISKIVPTHRAPQALILTPTRELALQVARELAQIAKHRGVVIECVYGGAPIGKQIAKLREGVHVVVGTPGRVLDHIGRRTLDCKTISMFTLDECDEMLSMGFLEDIERVVSHLPEKKQTMLFSATMPDEVTRYARRHMKAPETIALSKDSISVTDISHSYYIVSGIARSRDLLKIIFQEEPESAIIFCNTRDETTMVAKFLQKQGLDAEPLSSDLSQSDRERVMGRMKQHSLRFLCATDVAARGIDISNLSHVINYAVPETPEVYVHRTGRTGRAGKKGTAISLVGPRELGSFRYVRLTFGIKPEERVLPKDDIFVGKLKVPLPPVGTPQPPDPVQILMRGVQGTASDLERQIFEKLLAKTDGKRVLAKLVADKLDQLSTKSKPRRPRPEAPAAGAAEGAEADHGEQRFEDRGERRPRRFEDGDRPRGRFGGDRGERPEGGGEDRPRFRDRPEGGGDRPRFDRDRNGERGERHEGSEGRTMRFERGERGERGERPEGGGEGRPRFDRDRGERNGERPEGGADRPRFDRDRGGERNGERHEGGEGRTMRFERGERNDRGERSFDRDRPRRDRDDRGGRFDRDRGERQDRGERHDRPAAAAPPSDAAPVSPELTAEPGTEAAPAVEVREQDQPRENREPRGDRGDRGDRDRGERGDRDRGDRRDRHDRDRRDRPASGDRDRDRDRDRHARRDQSDTRIDVPAAELNAAVETAMEAPVETVEAERPAGRPHRDTLVDAAVEVATTAPLQSHVDEVAARAIERADRTPAERPERTDRNDKKTGGKRDTKKAAPTEETREFWETWAEEKSTRPADPEPAPAPAAAADSDERPARDDRRGGKSRDRGRGRSDTKGDRDSKSDRDAKPERKSERSEAKADDKQPRGKKAEAAAPAASASAAADGAQARLFISLGKKHGVSADDLRSLLSAPVGGDKGRIGSVSLRDSHAHVRVPEELVDAIIAGVHGTSHNDHDVTVERARA